MNWDQRRSAVLANEIVDELRQWNQQPTLRDILALERKLVHSPHTSPYIPHNSLAFHHRFTSLCFYFIYKQLLKCKSVDKWQQLSLAVVTIKPDSLSLFYRLKDVKAHETTVRERLRQGLFERVFQPYKADLPQMTIDANPFEFFGRDAVVVVVEDAVALLDSLQEIVDEDDTESLGHLVVNVIHCAIKKHDSWTMASGKWKKVPPRNVEWNVEERHLLSARARHFERSVTPRCDRCGQPLDPVEAAGSICSPCSTLLKQTEGVGGQIEGLFPETERRGFVFLNLPEPLLDEAKRQADMLLAELKKDSQRFKPKPTATAEQQAEVLAQIKSTPTGIFEYLQAVMEIALFQEDVLAQSPNVFPLMQFPTLMIWVTSEREYWDFVAKVGDMLQELHLKSSLSGLLCHPRTPFWSLMDRLTNFEKREGIYERGIFYDLSGGETVVFTDNEVKAIRDLARRASGDMAFKNQLNALVQLARMATLRELELEIDERDNLRKIRSDFCAELKTALLQITGDDQRTRDKRALFIKNIVRLAGFSPERQAERSQSDRAQQPYGKSQDRRR